MKKTMRLLCLILMISQVLLATIINVPDDQPTIQQGLNTATEGDTVLVATGTYYENLFWPMTNEIKLFSEVGADSTIIDGSNLNIIIYIYSATSIDTTTIIDGFTIQNGIADTGAGITCYNSSPKIQNCVISNNNGGGLAFTTSSSIIRDCDITNNNGNGFKIIENSDILIQNSNINNNNDSGVYFLSSTGHIIDCDISYNTVVSEGGGIYSSNSELFLSNNSISNNTGSQTGDIRGGGIYMLSSDITVLNTIISNNIISGGYDVEGGGLYCSGSSSNESNLFMNFCSIIGNEAIESYNSGGGLYSEGYCNPVIENSVFSDNSAIDGQGGGLWSWVNVSLINVTICNNTSASGGGFYGRASHFENVDILCFSYCYYNVCMKSNTLLYLYKISEQ